MVILSTRESDGRTRIGHCNARLYNPELYYVDKEMYEEDSEIPVNQIVSNLHLGDGLETADIKQLLKHNRRFENYEDLDEYQKEIDAAITESTGHAAYVEILREFKESRIIGEMRLDLVDPSLEPEGFERIGFDYGVAYTHTRIGEKATEGVGTIRPPNKRPTSVPEIRYSLLDYLFCVGKGFHFDAEMIYDHERDHRELLCAILDRVDEFDDCEVTVECDQPRQGGTVRVNIVVQGHSYTREFLSSSDWLDFEVLDPVEEALADHTSQTLYYRGGNCGWMLVF